MNWNIRLAFLFTFTAALGGGIIYTALAVFVTQGLGQVNYVLGNMFTISGITSTVFIFPSSYFADKFRRDWLIRVSVISGVFAQLCLIFSTTLTATPQKALLFLFLSQLLAGLTWGLSGPASQALIADSVESGNRSELFAYLHFVNLAANATGPFLAAGMTLILGDNWTIEVLRNIILVGAFFNILSFLVIVWSSDNKTVVSHREVSSSPTVEDEQATGKVIQRNTKEDTEYKFLGRYFSYDIYIPAIITMSGIIIGFGAGMTVAFFPVLFADPDIGYGLKPFLTYIIFGITNLTTGVMGIVAQKSIKLLGRVGAMFLTQGLAVICLLGIIINLVLYQNDLIHFELGLILLICFFISRNALMNAAGPISRSIVMDIVPSRERARWNSLEALAWGMFWSVSASIGGFVVDRLGFVYVFLCTATLYTIGTLLLLRIRHRVPQEIKTIEPFTKKTDDKVDIVKKKYKETPTQASKTSLDSAG